jgi:tRNA threonylcarbamoyladenosine biosynthesis protein TsaE
MEEVVARSPPSEIESNLFSRSPAQTFALGERLGRLLQPGDFVGLVGELGTGKTQFVRGVASGAGIDPAQVSSPSFAIIAAYRGRFALYHADLFRIRDYDEIYATGFTDLPGRDGALVVEWLDRVPRAAPPELLLLSFEDCGGEQRSISARAFGPRYAARLRTWIGAGV